jgi:hypothetical protein
MAYHKNPCHPRFGRVSTFTNALIVLVLLLGGGGKHHQQLGRMISVQAFQVGKTSSSYGGGSSTRDPSIRKTMTTPSTTTTSTTLSGLFGGMFGGSDKATITNSHEKDAVLATYTIVDGSNNNNNNKNEDEIIQKQNSLLDYLTVKWVRLFEMGTIQLTTPVDFITTKVWDPEEGVESVDGVQLLFKKRKVGSGYVKYNNKPMDVAQDAVGVEGVSRDNTNNNESDNDSSDGKTTTKKKKEEPKEGGIEILVERLRKDQKEQLRVRARRCEVDEGTVIKEMSEETIINELSQAIDAWRKENK